MVRNVSIWYPIVLLVATRVRESLETAVIDQVCILNCNDRKNTGEFRRRY